MTSYASRSLPEEAEILEMHAHQLELSGDDILAIRQMEKALIIRCQPVKGKVDVDGSINAAERLVVKCNTTAVKAFKTDDYDTGVLLLENALRLTDEVSPLSSTADKRLQLRGTTLNNFGCLERRRGRLEAALNYMRLSLTCAGQQSPATYLNMSAVQLQLGLHQESVGSARRSIGLLESIPSEYPGMIAIAYHNLAMALESIDQAACVHAYETALHHAMRDLGKNSLTTQAIEKNLIRFRAKPSTKQNGVTLPPLSTKGTTQSILPHPFTANAEQSSAPRRRESPSTPPITKRKAPAAHASDKESEAKAAPTPKPPHAPQPPRLAPHRPTTKSSDKEKSKEASDKEAPQPKEKEVQDSNAHKRAKEKKEESAKAASAAQITQEESHRSDDVVAFMHNRLCTLIQAEELFETRFRMSLRIQCMVRCNFARKALVSKRKERLKKAKLRAVRDQACARIVTRFFRLISTRAKKRKLAAQQENEMLSVKTKAARTIQRGARRWIKRRRIRSAKFFGAASTKALRILQCWFRQCLAKKKILTLKNIAKRVQGQVLYQEKLTRAAIDVQRTYRTHIVARIVAKSRGERYDQKEKERKNRVELSILKIQAFVKGTRSREAFEVKRKAAEARNQMMRRMEDRRLAAIALQAWARGMKVRSQTQVMLRSKSALRAAQAQQFRHRITTIIQCLFRCFSARRERRRLHNARHCSFHMKRDSFRTMLIQKSCRGYQARKTLGQKLRAATNRILLTRVEAGKSECDAVQEQPVQLVATETEPLRVASAQPDLVSATSDTVQLAPQEPEEPLPTNGTQQAPTESEQAFVHTEAAEPVASDPTDPAESKSEKLTPMKTKAQPDENLPAIPTQPLLEAPTQMEAVSPAQPSERQSTEPVQSDPDRQVQAEAKASEKVEPAKADPVGSTKAPPNVAAQPATQVEKQFVPQPPRCGPSAESRISQQSRRDAKRTNAAIVIRRVFRGFVDRQYARNRRVILQQYVEDLVERHRVLPEEAATTFKFDLLNKFSYGMDEEIEKTRAARRIRHVQCFMRFASSKAEVFARARASVARSQQAASTIQRFRRIVVAKGALRRRRESLTSYVESRSAREKETFEHLESGVVLLQSVLEVHVSAKVCNDLADAKQKELQKQDEAAVVIQGAFRIRDAKAEAAARKKAKADRWQNIEGSNEVETCEPQAAEGISNTQAEAREDVDHPVQGHVDPQQARDAAAIVIQRNARKMAAKETCTVLREEHRIQWEEKRRLAEQEVELNV